MTQDKEKIQELVNGDEVNIHQLQDVLNNLLDKSFKDLPLGTKRLIGEALDTIHKKSSFEKFSDLVSKIDLISDSGQFAHRAPRKVFDTLRGYLDESVDNQEGFERRFKKLSKLFLRQYQESDLFTNEETGKSEFSGYEWIGGGMSSTNDNYTVNENHFVRYALRPGLNRYYENHPEKAYKFVKNFCIYRENREITHTRENPDFLLRSSVDVLLHEYADGNEEALGILKEFMQITDGLPDKTSLIFESVYNEEIRLSQDQKWELVEVQLELEMYEGQPANVFVEKIIADLAAEGHDLATETLEFVVKDEVFLKRGLRSGDQIAYRLERVAENNSQLATNLLESFIKTDFFREDFDTFEASKLSHVVYSLLIDNDTQETVLGLLEDISDQEGLSKSQQVIVTGSLIDPSTDDPEEEYLDKIYSEFLCPLLESLDKDLRCGYESGEYGKIYEKFPLSLARENIVKFADKLVETGRIQEALKILEIFAYDPHPFEPDGVNPEDKKGEHALHNKIASGEKDEISLIATVRGWCGWVLRKCVTIEGRDQLPKIIDLAKKLVNDKNYFVQIYGIYALAALNKNRLSVMPNNKDKLFFDLEGNLETALKRAKELEDITFSVLGEVVKYPDEAQKAFSNPLAHLLSSVNAVNQEKSNQLLNVLLEASDSVVASCAAVFIYFAELREDDFESWRWEEDDLYDDLDNFDPGYAQKKLKEAMKRSEETRKAFSNRLMLAPDHQEDRGLDIALKYLPLLTDEYHQYTLHNIYRFVKDNVHKKPDECADLALQALEIEKDFYSSLQANKLKEYYWHPYHHTGELLQNLYEHGDQDKFLEAVGVVSEFPEELHVSLAGVMEILRDEISTDDSNKIADKLKRKFFNNK